MGRQRTLLLLVAAATVAAMPGVAQTPAAAPAASEAHGAAPIPDFTKIWTHPAFPWFEPAASGPGPVTNLSRWAVQRPADPLAGTQAQPPAKVGISDYDQLVGDYHNPILQPWAAEVVKKTGEMALAGVEAPEFFEPVLALRDARSSTSSRPWQMIQKPDVVTIIYSGDFEISAGMRLNQSHPSPLTAAPHGTADSGVGHYEGDTLVIDTVGVKADRPYAVIDLFGTPYTDKLHVVERYRLRDYDEVKDALERNRKENWLFQGDVWTRHRNEKFLQAEVTIDDPGVFTMPWSATLTYAPEGAVAESVCAENLNEYYDNKDVDAPKADKPDF